ncbi:MULTISPECIES: RHS repeat domain-containing protein [Lysobacter]|uniref:RHS repeat domain-containing protein n=1 Tax=Lysobacter TaxID=68 RepID=UPI001F39FB42|nr:MULTISPECIES: RHS repeat domain-containing protein [Lysobacter]UJB17686.1 RHS repeat protein [Lysobacter capsici]UJQ28592.1 RHS repeat protein [Lysobacter gummosus]
MTSKIPFSFRALSVAITVCCVSASAYAGVSSPTVLEDYDGLTKGVAVTALTADGMFGDSTSLFDGATTFSATDVSLKTNSALTVSIGRRLSNAGLSLNTWRGGETSVFGRYWVLDVPNIHGTFDKRTGWVVRDRDYNGPQFPETWMGSTQRCSVADFTPPRMPDKDMSDNKSSYGASDYWAGNLIDIPGSGEELMLNLSAGHARPSDGLAYYGGTKSNWKVACLPSIRNGAGEGFLVVLPNGQRYTFDWMVTRGSKRVEGSPGEFGGGLGIDRVEVFLYATRVEDTQGNWLSYEYDLANPHRLLSIRSNDGVEANLTYNASGKIETISSAGRVWTYEYAPFNEDGASPYSYWLTGVVLPDGGRWGYQYGDHFDFMHADRASVWLGCSPTVGTMSSASEPKPDDVGVFTISHPSGALGEFKFRKLLHGTNKTEGHCTPRQEQFWTRLNGSPMAYTVGSLYSKTITGPGVPASTWSYFYKPTWSWIEDCNTPGTCITPAETQLTNPDRSVNVYKFNNDYTSNVGELIEQSVKSASGQVVRIVTNSYVQSADGQLFPAVNGELPKISGSKGYLNNRPLKTRQIVQDGVTFVTENQTFDSFARAVHSTGYNTLGYSRNEGTEFYDHASKWILGQIAATSINGAETGRAEFDPVTALPLRVSSFGKPKSAFTYRADGTLETVKDGNGNATMFNDWKRGVPQSIQRPATPESPSGSIQSAVVDNRGWVTSTTDENGFTTQYSYDGMGRLAGVIYPQDDTVDWHPTTQEFVRVASPEYGLEANHWRRVSITGERRSDTYYDAFLRPVLEMEFDLADASRNTQKQTFTRYDNMGRMVFRSNPTRHIGDFRQSMAGVSYSYDTLGRIISATQDSELGPLTSTTEYLAGFKRKTTNPRGLSAVETFQVFGQPNYESPAVIDAPESVRTQIMRDAYGKPLEIQRLSTAQ